MDNTNVHSEDFNIDSYLEKWNDENIGDESEDVEESEADKETEEATAGTVEDLSAEESAHDAEDEEDEDDASGNDGEQAASEDKDSNTKANGNDDESEDKEKSSPSAKSADGFKERFDAALSEIQSEFPDVKSASDIGDVRTFSILTIVGGMSALDAYKAVKNKSSSKSETPSRENVTNEEIAAAEARGAQKAAGKSHLQSAVPKETGKSTALTDSEAEAYSEELGIPIKEVRKLYQRVTK